MPTTLRVVIDQTSSGSDLAVASVELARALIRTAPGGCEVDAIVPAGQDDLTHVVPGLSSVRTAPLQRRELLAGWQLGVAPPVGGGLIHSASLAAPLVRHDRINAGDQTTVTVWDLQAWETSGELHRSASAWQKGMMRRVVRHADAVVVPTYAIAERLAEEFALGDRIRVIPGALPHGFRLPPDADARRRDLILPARYIAVEGTPAPSDGLAAAFRAVAANLVGDRQVVVFGVPVGDEARVTELAAAAGVPEARVHARPVLDVADRAAVLAGSEAFVTAVSRSAWPWRVLEAQRLGVPVVAADTPVLTEVVGDGGIVAPAAALGPALEEALGERAAALRVLGQDHERAFTWDGAAERVWQLHAEL
ncbi:glycosyltransferase [Microbacterium gorillae]|uniref:glycosyltransferase n=1 Tax=Microbacterium gorillae TaxID=1231063 RepID=UPI0005901D46|nr:glycosyltransferase [Microbacterium gorillae]